MECNEYKHDNNGDVDKIKFTRISAIVGKAGNFKIGTTIVGKEGEKYVMSVLWDIPIFPDVCLEAYEYNKYPYEKYKQLEDGSDSTPYCIIEERTSKVFGDDHVNNKFVVFGSRKWTFLRILKAYGYAWLRALFSWSLIFALVLFFVVPRCRKQDNTPNELNDIVFYDKNGGMKKGVFSVSDSTKVQFSCGNLLYKPESKEWFFAPWQGADTQKKIFAPWQRLDEQEYISSFTWIGADDPVVEKVDYNLLLESNQFHRYGYYPIKNGGNAYSQWRMMTYSEWTYLLWHRPNARKLRQRSEIAWPKHRWIEGFFIFPDGWKWPEGVKGSWDVAYYSVEEWQKMMIAGAVFLPYIDNSSGSSVLTWTSSYKLDTLKSGEIRCLPYYVLPFKLNFDIRTAHRELERIPVRLVKDVGHRKLTNIVNRSILDTILYFNNGEYLRYEGAIVEGKFEGKGKLYYRNGDVYMGYFKNNKFHGHGKYTSPNRWTFEGEYQNGIREGKGKLTFADGHVISGVWENGIRPFVK